MATEITAHIAGTVWKVLKGTGDPVGVGDEVVILESMKMEVPVEAAVAGTIREVRCSEGDAVAEGDVLAVVD